jgi:two-component system response regulator LytT
MRVLILEDEPLSADRLVQLLEEYPAKMEVVEILEAVEDAGIWLSTHPMPDLIFMDIHLSDANVFELFKYVTISAPIIFTTAFDEYAVQAFDVNSIAYLLKPVSPTSLQQALDKLETFKQTFSQLDISVFQQLIQKQNVVYKERFLVRIGQQYKHLATDDILWFRYYEGQVIAYTKQGREYPIEQSISKLSQLLNPQLFFQVNRAYIIHISAIQKIHTWFNQRLKLDIQGSKDSDIIVSREKVADFKQWLDS